MQFSQTIRKTFTLYAAQLINLFLGWVVAKFNVSYLSVTEYGQFSFFITAINICYIFFTFGIFESSSRLIILTESKRDYRKILSVTILFSSLSYLLFSLLFWFSHLYVDSIFQVQIGTLIKDFFAISGFYLLFEMFQKVLRGAGKIKKMAALIVSPRLFYISFLLILILTGHFVLESTVLFNLVSYSIIVFLFIFSEKPDFHGLRSSVSKLWKEIKRFGVHVYWSDLVNTFLYHTDKLFIGFFLDAEQLAYYALSFTVTLPLSLFSTALSTSLYRQFSKEKKINKKILWFNVIWVIVSITFLILLRKWIILQLFSDKYMASLTVFPVLALAFALGGFGKLYVFFLTAKGAGKEIRDISILVLVFNIGSNLIFIPLWGIMGAAFTRLFTYLLDLLLLLFFYKRYIRKGGTD